MMVTPSIHDSAQSRDVQLSVVLPVYNEEEAIKGVLQNWTAVLDSLDVNYELLVLDDGSTDRTPEILENLLSGSTRLRVTHQENQGHGPTLIRGYSEAIGRWVFQADSDGEIPAEEFEKVWPFRRSLDYLLGCREGRRSSIPRQVVTGLARMSVRVFFGRLFQDVNCPFRLIRRSCLEKLLEEVPIHAFAPNVILAGLAAYHRLRIEERNVRNVGRQIGRSSLSPFKLTGGAVRTFRQLVSARLHVKPWAEGEGGP